MNYLYAAIGALALLVALVFGMNKWESRIEQRGYNHAVADYEQKAVIATNNEREEERRRNAEQAKAQEADRKSAELARADAARSRAAVVELQSAIDTYLNNRPTSGNTGTGNEREASTTLGNLFGQCNKAFSVLGESADKARNAGVLCEASYNALRPTIREQVEGMRK